MSEEQYERLMREAKQRGASLGSLIRDALDETYPAPDYERKKKALEKILAMEELPVPDWETMEEEILTMHDWCPDERDEQA